MPGTTISAITFWYAFLNPGRGNTATRGDRLLAKLVNTEASNIRTRSRADQGDFRTLAMDNSA